MLNIEATRVHISRAEWPLLPIGDNYTLLRFQGVGTRVGCKYHALFCECRPCTAPDLAG